MRTQRLEKKQKIKHMEAQLVTRPLIHYNKLLQFVIFPVTIISVTIMTSLFWIEFLDYLTPNVSEELFVDTSRSPNIQINIDIVVPSISCDCNTFNTLNQRIT